MPAAHRSLLERITIDPDVRFGKQCTRNYRITVQEILDWLFRAVYAYAAKLAAGTKVSSG